MQNTKKFIFDELNDSGRIHINLSEEAWNIIKQDMDTFYYEDISITISGFLNRVFTAYYQDADASLYTRYEQKRNELDILFPDNCGNADASDQLEKLELNEIRIEERRHIKLQLLNAYINTLKNKIASYCKGHAFKLKLNKENLSIISELFEGEYYNCNLGKYLKAIFEEYTRLPSYKREQFFFKETCVNFKEALSNGKQLKLILIKRTKNNPTRDVIQRKFYFSPYKLEQDPTMNFNYLIGVAQELTTTGEVLDKKITSFRLSRIQKSNIMLSLSGFISKEVKAEIDKTLKSKGVQFLVGDLIEVKIRFNQKGLEHFKKQIYMRPNNFEKIDSSTFIFNSTKAQIINYFFKFGKNIEILEPLELRNEFKTRYFESLNVYK